MSKPATKLTRRRFIASSASLAVSSVKATQLAPLIGVAAAQPTPDFRSDWDACPDRVWPGQDYWANPLQDWRIAKGRIDCTNAAADRNVQALTRHIGERKGTLDMRVRVGRVDGGNRSIVGSGAEGFSDM
jgi:alkaline phosphatase D